MKDGADEEEQQQRVDVDVEVEGRCGRDRAGRMRCGWWRPRREGLGGLVRRRRKRGCEEEGEGRGRRRGT